MSDIYVTGHRNPDTDSIASALSYAALRNASGERVYRPVRLGSVNDETQRLLDFLGVEPPELVGNLRTQVKDLDFDRTPAIGRSVTIDFAWRTMQEQDLKSVPVVDDGGKLCGMVSPGDLASFELRSMGENRIEDVPIFNLLSVLEGSLVNDPGVDSISGNVSISLPQNYESELLTDPQSILICGDQPEMINKAIEAKVRCLILCRADIMPHWKSVADTVIISTPLCARHVSRLINQALPVGRMIGGQKVVAFRTSDYVDDVRETMLKSRFRSYPVLDDEGNVLGTVGRFHLLRPRRKQVVLVDHNEVSQSVLGLDQVEILEIIDHHRLADIQTGQPILMRNEPVGCTATILTSMYQEQGLMPSPKIAGLMAGAILSDTVMFKSPTCTKRDVAAAERLSRIAGVSLDELGRVLFAAGEEASKSVEELFSADYKQFHIAEKNIGVSQVSSVDPSGMLARREEFRALMERLKKEQSYDLVILMITDILKEGSTLLFAGDEELIHQAFGAEPVDGQVFLPGVMSRKKQIIPMLTVLWG